MVKILKMENLDCAHCASQMEKKIKKIQGVNSVSISFMAAENDLGLQRRGGGRHSRKGSGGGQKRG